MHHVSSGLVSRLLRAATSLSGATIRPQQASNQQPRGVRPCSAASGALSILQAGTRTGPLLLGSAVGGGGVLLVQAAGNAFSTEPEEISIYTSGVPWVKQLESSSEEMLSPGQMMRKHPVGKLVLEQDHLFETMQSSSQIHEFRCFYEQATKRFHSVFQLGKDVCGFPQTVHGGLTAAIIDETFGGLGICMWRSGALGVRLPAYTARLEVDYKQKIPAGSLILCTTELEKIEGRKVWMKATVTDGKGSTFASARALFVAPRMPGENFAESCKRWLASRLRKSPQ